MNRSYSKIRHIQQSNVLLEQRRINEEEWGAIKSIAAKAKGMMDDAQKQKFTELETKVKGSEVEIKKFQDWMDTKSGGWVATKDNTGKTQYGKLNKGGGYGKFGPSTEAAWQKYGMEYLGGETVGSIMGF